MEKGLLSSPSIEFASLWRPRGRRQVSHLPKILDTVFYLNRCTLAVRAPISLQCSPLLLLLCFTLSQLKSNQRLALSRLVFAAATPGFKRKPKPPPQSIPVLPAEANAEVVEDTEDIEARFMALRLSMRIWCGSQYVCRCLS